MLDRLGHRHWKPVCCQLLEQCDKPITKKTTLHLGLDVHKASIAITIAEGGRGDEVRFYGTISNDLHAIETARTERRHEVKAVLTGGQPSKSQ